jgi:hypothetical protein
VKGKVIKVIDGGLIMSGNKGCNTGGCGCSSTVEQNTSELRGTQTEKKRRIEIDFLYLDLEVCSPCRSTESNIEDALNDVAGILKATGVEVTVRKTHVESLEQAIELGFLSSPTVRIGGQDLQLSFKENYCATCSQVSGTQTDCRVWLYQGQEYSAPPKAMIIEAVLQEVYGSPRSEPAKIVRPENALENLARFFESRGRKELAGGAV